MSCSSHNRVSPELAASVAMLVGTRDFPKDVFVLPCVKIGSLLQPVGMLEGDILQWVVVIQYQ